MSLLSWSVALSPSHPSSKLVDCCVISFSILLLLLLLCCFFPERGDVHDSGWHRAGLVFIP
jgi:hypothetical protein